MCMKEKLIASLQIACEPGLPLSLRYYLLEETTRAAAVAPGVTRNRQYASELIARLAGEGVTPAGLADVLAGLL